MGQPLSRQHNYNSNDELINMLVKKRFIQTMDVEKVFRSVDRGLYLTNNEKHNAYRDSAWRLDKMLLSAPRIYATVLENLELKPGNKFLNIGSGIGYFNTLAGLLLNVNGINHGIEIHQSLIDCAHQKLEEFKLNSAAIDYYHFCEPVFMQGNFREISTMGFYDRVYCGVGVLERDTQYLMSLVKIGGILVMQLNGVLLKITRKDDHSWQTLEVSEISIPNIVIPELWFASKKINFPPVKPLTLQELCRFSIRSFLRENLKNNSPHLPIRTICSKKNYLFTENFDYDTSYNQFVRMNRAIRENLLRTPHFADLIADFNADDDFQVPDFVVTGLHDHNDDGGDEEEEEVVEEQVDNEVENCFDEFNDGDDNDDSSAAGDSMCTKSHNCEKAFEDLLKVENELMNENQQKNTAQTANKSTKRKLPEAESSKQDKILTGTATEVENLKRMKSDKFPEETKSKPSTSSDGSNLLDTVSINSSVQEEDTNNQVSSMGADITDVDEDFGNEGPREVYNLLFNGDSEAARQMPEYNFINKRKENELSKLLKGIINSLPIPVPLKTFLNYNLID